MNDHPKDALFRAGARFARAVVLIALVAATTAGCADRRPHQAETAPYLEKGSASISGVVTIDTGQGQITAPVSTLVYRPSNRADATESDWKKTLDLLHRHGVG